MRAVRKKRGLVNWDWCFGERMETNSVCEKDKKRIMMKMRLLFLHSAMTTRPRYLAGKGEELRNKKTD